MKHKEDFFSYGKEAGMDRTYIQALSLNTVLEYKWLFLQPE